MLSKYELQVLREAVLSDLEMWQERVDRGDDINPRFLATLEALEEKLNKMIEEYK